MVKQSEKLAEKIAALNEKLKAAKAAEVAAADAELVRLAHRAGFAKVRDFARQAAGQAVRRQSAAGPAAESPLQWNR
ncbi:MAG: hypothetical protein EPN38_01785 [Rhodanobacteraceae bacterium]|nr:MAG: hypothetical protein EPN38_01785 [Rhodanobacteraceae bacterium]